MYACYLNVEEEHKVPTVCSSCLRSHELLGNTVIINMALPNLRRLFVEARTEAEENEYSRNAVRQNLTFFILDISFADHTLASSTIWYFSSPPWLFSAWLRKG